MIEIKQVDITELNVDAIVNAANSQLKEGGGVCGAIFNKAESAKLTEACYKIGSCEQGNSVITPGFDLTAKYIIHAVGPIWSGGDDNEAELLYNAYKNSLLLSLISISDNFIALLLVYIFLFVHLFLYIF